MKTRLLKSVILKNKQRCGVALLLCAGFALFVFTLGVAQVREQRRVTGLQLGEAAEGSRVTIVSDSALSDYEAFRSGDRFYVKIPLADFTSAVPHFRAAGLDSVQVQKVGDSLIVSFKLQPGATARVEQRGNRLDVIFSAANRSSNNPANTGASRTSPGGMDPGRDTAGPMPPGSVAASRDRVVTDRTSDGSDGRVQNPWVSINPQNEANKGTKRSLKDQSANVSIAVPSPLSSPSPRSSPSSFLPPGNSTSYTPLTSVTPAVSPAARPVDASSGSGGFINLRRRGAAALQWAAANRLATLLGTLILLSLILYLLMALRGRKEKVVKAKRATAPKVQPKYSADGELNELPSPSPAVVSEKATRPNHVHDQRDNREPQPTLTAVTRDDEFGLTRPTLAPPTAAPDEYSSEEEEREVFEL